MLTFGLLADVREVVQRTFRGGEDFSCLVGSCASGTATAASDIDIVVVLADRVPRSEALTARDAFTREYVHLHHRHGRRPDLQYPGEVLYRRDLAAALRGRCLSRSGGWCDQSEPYRFWVSMIATGVPLTGVESFGPAADACADVIVAHTGPGGTTVADLGLDPGRVAACPRLARRLRTDVMPRPPAPVSADTSVPVLESHWDRWRRTAGLAHRAACDR